MLLGTLTGFSGQSSGLTSLLRSAKHRVQHASLHYSQTWSFILDGMTKDFLYFFDFKKSQLLSYE